MSELCFTPATELAARIAARELSPVELMDAVLARISEQQPRLNAFCLLRAEEAREEARAAQDSEPRGPLHGIPISIKDLSSTKGIRTTFGSKAFADNVPDVDATFVTRLREAGAILLGKTNTPEFGNKGVTDSPLHGTTANPWSLDRTAGGSSGGAAAAVAAGPRPARRGLRRRRLDPHPGQLLRRRRPQAVVRARADVPAQRLPHDLPPRPARPHGRRRGADALGDGRAPTSATRTSATSRPPTTAPPWRTRTSPAGRSPSARTSATCPSSPRWRASSRARPAPSRTSAQTSRRRPRCPTRASRWP